MNTLLMPSEFFTGKLVIDPFKELREGESFDGCLDANEYIPKGSVSVYPLPNDREYQSQTVMRKGAIQ